MRAITYRNHTNVTLKNPKWTNQTFRNIKLESLGEGKWMKGDDALAAGGLKASEAHVQEGWRGEEGDGERRRSFKHKPNSEINHLKP